MITTILLIALPLVGVVCGWCARWVYGKFELSVAEQRAERILYDAKRDAEAKAKDVILDVQKTLLRERSNLEKDLQGRRGELQKFEQRLEQRERELEKYAGQLKKTEKGCLEREKRANQALAGVDAQRNKLVEELENISSLTKDEAKRLMIQSLEKDVERESQMMIKRIEQEAQEVAQRNARRILVGAIQRITPEINTDLLQTTVQLPNGDMKGRIIGKEGRNIRAIETVTGADIVIDDTPEAVTVSCFDPVRREVARRSLDILIRDGRIHPARIEQTVNSVRKEMNEMLREKGEQTLSDLDIHHIDPQAI